MRRRALVTGLAVVAAAQFVRMPSSGQTYPRPSWQEVRVKQTIHELVARVTMTADWKVIFLFEMQ